MFLVHYNLFSRKKNVIREEKNIITVRINLQNRINEVREDKTNIDS